MNEVSAGAASDRWKEERAKTQELLGKILMLWGDIMGLVYRLPEALGFSNPEAIQLGLAQINGDASRVAYLSKLLKHEPKLADVDAQRSADALAALSKLKNERQAGRFCPWCTRAYNEKASRYERNNSRWLLSHPDERVG